MVVSEGFWWYMANVVLREGSCTMILEAVG